MQIVIDAAPNGATVVTLVGEVELSSHELLAERLAACEGAIVVDLAGVPFLDSMGIGVLVATRRRVVEAGGSFELRNPQPSVGRVLDVVGLGDWITG